MRGEAILFSWISGRLPGLALCSGIGLAAMLCEQLEVAVLGHAWFETLVLAIVLGALLRMVWAPPPAFASGIQFASKTLLEIAVAMIGVTVSLGMVAGIGLPLLLGTLLIVSLTIVAGILLGLFFGLPYRMAALLACGNAICGNSAIASVAPAIGADNDEVAAAVTFTAVPSIALVAALPIIADLLQLSPIAGGTLAGLTVYAVPQVIAAAAPLGREAVEIGALVKLVRVLTLGPVAAIAAVLGRRKCNGTAARHARPLPYVPWFILVFLSLAALRSAGFVPEPLAAAAHEASGILAVLAMAGLGLGVDFGKIAQAGFRIIAVVVLSLCLLCGLALLMLWTIGLM